MKETVVVYHADCPDGFGGAYAAWKKFGDAAEYMPKRHGEPAPETLAGRDVFMIDFSYEKETLQKLAADAKSFVILDHHIGAKEAVESIPNHVFDNDHSGAAIAWSYFHPETPLPRMLTYIEDNDLWRHSLPDGKVISSYLHTVPMTFEAWDTTVALFENDETFAAVKVKGAHFREYNEYVIQNLGRDAQEVLFEGYKVLAVNAPRLFRSELGNMLAEKCPPFAIVWYEYHGQIRASLRGNGEADLSEIAGRYGGNGHKNAASFRIEGTEKLPWKKI